MCQGLWPSNRQRVKECTYIFIVPTWEGVSSKLLWFNDLPNCPSSGWTKHLWVYALMVDVPSWMCIERPKRFCEKYVQTKGKYGIRIYIWWGVGSMYQVHGKLWGVYEILTRRKGLPRKYLKVCPNHANFLCTYKTLHTFMCVKIMRRCPHG
jgi:hypothetical protein